MIMDLIDNGVTNRQLITDKSQFATYKHFLGSSSSCGVGKPRSKIFPADLGELYRPNPALPKPGSSWFIFRGIIPKYGREFSI